MLPATLMVHVPPGDQVASLLQFANEFAVRIKARKIIGIAALRPLQAFAGPEGYVPQEFFQQDRDAMEKEFAFVEKQFRAALTDAVPRVEWRSSIVMNMAADYMAAQMRAADLLITPSRPRAALFDDTRYVDLAGLVLKAGRPVLVVGPGVTKLDIDNVMIAWNDSREARRAIEDAVPLLRMAGTITVVEVADRDELAEADARLKDVVDWLAGHGIAANARVEAGGDEDALVLSGIAQDLKAGLVVAGAYGHSRLREWVIGGVTRDLLLQPAQCSFVSH